MRRFLAIASALALAVLPAICGVMECGAAPEVSSDSCCPHEQPGSKHSPDRVRAAQPCPYQLLQKGKTPRLPIATDRSAEPFAAAFAYETATRPAARERAIDRSKAYLLHCVLLI